MPAMFLRDWLALRRKIPSFPRKANSLKWFRARHAKKREEEGIGSRSAGHRRSKQPGGAGARALQRT